VGIFRRGESLHERLAREGGLVEGEETQLDPRPRWQETGVHGIQRAREWDATVTVDVPDIEADAARFVALPDGSLLVEEGPDDSLDPLAAAVEQELRPPYRARAARQGDSLWAVQARRIEVLELSDAPEGDAIDLTHTRNETTLAVDGARTFGSVTELEQRGEREGTEYAVHAERLDGDLWEISASPL
jgi:hypothetical protein